MRLPSSPTGNYTRLGEDRELLSLEYSRGLFFLEVLSVDV